MIIKRDNKIITASDQIDFVDQENEEFRQRVLKQLLLSSLKPLNKETILQLLEDNYYNDSDNKRAIDYAFKRCLVMMK